MSQSSRTPKILQSYPSPSFRKIDIEAGCFVHIMYARDIAQSVAVKCYTDRKCDSCFDTHIKAGILFVKQNVISPEQQERDAIVLYLPKNIDVSADLKGDFARLISRTRGKTDVTLDSTRSDNVITAQNLTLRLYNTQTSVHLERAGTLDLTYLAHHAQRKPFFTAEFLGAPLSVMVRGDKNPAYIETHYSSKAPYIAEHYEPSEVVGVNLARRHNTRLSYMSVTRT